MALDPVNTSDVASQRGAQEAIKVAVQQLQGLRFSVVNGATATTSIAVTGLDAAGTIIGAVYFPISTGTVTSVSDIKSEASIPSAGNVAFSTTNTTSGKILVIWLNEPDTSG